MILRNLPHMHKILSGRCRVILRMRTPKQRKCLLSRGNFCVNTSITDHTSSHKATDVVRAASALLTEFPPPLYRCICHRKICESMLPSPCHRSHSHTSAATGTATTVGVLLPGQGGQENEAIDVLFRASVDLELGKRGASLCVKLALAAAALPTDAGLYERMCSNVTRTFCARSKPSLPTRH